MSKQVALEFRDKVMGSSELQATIREITDNGRCWDRWTDDTWVALGQQAGYSFTGEDARAAWKEVETEGELSDFELELIAGGCPADWGYTNTPP